MSKRVRKAVFGPRSALPSSAACVVANGVRETLASLLGAPVELRLFDPVIPAAPGWSAILRDALLYRVRGAVADAALVLRAGDALALAAALFGERCERSRALSVVERDVLERMVRAIAVHLGSVCGARDPLAVEPWDAPPRFATYFELQIEAPVPVRIGVALSRDPAPDPGVRFEIGHLAAVPLTARAAVDLGPVPSGSLVALQRGAVLPFPPQAMQRCTLVLAGRPIARGGCGIRNGRYALSVAALLDGS